ncbi:cytochrome P450 [Nocardiopsis deserti]|uniref:cytochrome P450 n=1 Tax=Nocardiopsis deserti TaxID=2605988 RepID=UPI001239092F|nr:cytochrome P450 [Nocardiopsis deserti]
MTDTTENVFEVPTTLEERIRRWSVYQPWLQRDPVTYFKEIQEYAPIVRSEELGGYWILTRFEEMEWAARTPETFSNLALSIPSHINMLGDRKAIPIQLDGEEHRKWRRALADLFNPGAVNHFTPQIRQAIADTMDPWVEQGRTEFIGDIASKIPAEAFLIMFGIDRKYLGQILEYKEWLRSQLPKAHNDEAIAAASRPLWDFFGEAIDRRREEGTEGRRDVFSRLLESKLDGEPLTRDQMINAAFTNMLAAFDTTTAMISVVFTYLAEHPEVQDLVIQSPERIPAVIEELVRHDPISATARLVTQDVERHGVTMRKGDLVLIPWGMSGMDPRVFENPDEVDFDRSSTRQLVFAVGPHRCIGMHLARRVLKLAVEEWHARVPRYGLTAGTSPHRVYTTVRGVSALDLSWPLARADEGAQR